MRISDIHIYIYICIYVHIYIYAHPPHDPYLCVLLVWIVGGGMHQNTAMLEKF